MICPKCGNKMIKQNNGQKDYYVCLKCHTIRFYDAEEKDCEINALLKILKEKGEIVIE